MERFFVIVSSVLMFLAVGAGAFGAHALSSYFSKFPALESSYNTAVRYQMIHGLALLAVAWIVTRWPGTLTNFSGYLFILGIFLFSGSLYALSLTGIRWFGAITPIGGVAFLGGWLVLLIVAWRA